MARLFQLSIVAASLTAASTSFGQMVHMVPAGVNATSAGVAGLAVLGGAGYWNGSGGNGWWGYHASTPYESFARGDAAVIRALGENAYLTAEANKANQDAYEHFLQNDRMRVEVYFAKKQTWDSWRATQRGPRPTPEQLARWADQQRPDRLAATQLNGESGKISWPAILMAPEFSDARNQLNALFTLRSQGAIQPHFVSDVKGSIGAMRTHLLEAMDRIPAMEYIAVDKFLDSLHYEAYFLPERVAMAN